MRKEVRFSGFGGQGIILAGVILGKAISLYGGKNAVQTQSYGPEARGGASKSEVVISEEEIDFPKVILPDVLISMSQPAFDKYGEEIKENATILIDKDLVSVPEEYESKNKVYKIPFTEIANKEIGLGIVANIVMLGSLTKILDVDPEIVKKALLESVPKGTEKKNTLAFEKGYDYIQ
ncbi:2-oxoglutarate ferredoxin oxidoreductase subunit gamma [Methanococcus voltae]|uniref:2-oxoacid:ferredoxin oxidoreductase subunit gamma n=1 Tax=Methanococcus voltae TaxID=2188 RepID=UPI001AE1E8EA|nr:2-oxoacid:ferredoxin oxidoreductase subunit gamma [Methanococcus voltae]MBP2143595.1 2-oxoglutarate ferredoxin oxidoreductase subunit gamma [Methanococcus voltae]